MGQRAPDGRIAAFFKKEVFDRITGYDSSPILIVSKTFFSPILQTSFFRAPFEAAKSQLSRGL